MKWYMYRNHKTGQEIKRKEPMYRNRSYSLVKVIDLSVSDKERKAK